MSHTLPFPYHLSPIAYRPKRSFGSSNVFEDRQKHFPKRFFTEAWSGAPIYNTFLNVSIIFFSSRETLTCVMPRIFPTSDWDISLK